jgi:hypothetical protein
MKEYFRRLAAALAYTLVLLVLVPSGFAAEEDKVTGEIAASVMSAYIWRGQEMTRNSIVVEPSATVSYKGFSVNVWGNLDTKPYLATDGNHSARFTETDITVSYSHKFGIVQLTPGYIYYVLEAPYSGAIDPLDSQEVFFTVGLDTILAPTVTVYKEIAHYHQWYGLLGISHTFALHEKIGLKLAATASYLQSEKAATYPEYDRDSVATREKFNNFHDGTVSVSVPVALTKSLTIAPILTYVFALSDDARYEMKGRGLRVTAIPADRDSSFLYGGITASFAF